MSLTEWKFMRLELFLSPTAGSNSLISSLPKVKKEKKEIYGANTSHLSLC